MTFELDPSVRAYYGRGEEAARLAGGAASGPLELARTRELIEEHLPPGRLEVLDVGGGPGAYATWLAGTGHEVRLVDPMPLHVEQAAAAGISVELGDARQLPHPDDSADVVLLFGPLYHLPDADDRRRALAEARRVLRPDGWLFAAAISRFAALLDLVVTYDRFHEPEVQRIVTDAVRTGTFAGAEADLGFATAYLHLPRELAAEVGAAGFVDVRVRGVEGAGSLTPDLGDHWRDADRREALLHAARLTATDPEILAVSSHLLAIARAPTAVTASSVSGRVTATEVTAARRG